MNNFWFAYLKFINNNLLLIYVMIYFILQLANDNSGFAATGGAVLLI